MEIDHAAIDEVIAQAEIDQVIADEMVLMECEKAHLELQKLVKVVREAREDAVAALMEMTATMNVRAIKDADEALSEINKTKVCMELTIINLEEKKVYEQMMVVGAAAGAARAAVQRAGNKLIVLGIKNDDTRIKSLHMWNNAVSMAWLMVYDHHQGPDITGTMEMVKNVLEHAMASVERAASVAQMTIDNIYTSHQTLIYSLANIVKKVDTDIIHNMTNVVNNMDKALVGLQSVMGKAVGWRAAAARAAGWAATAMSTAKADVPMTDVPMTEDDARKPWVEGLDNYNKRQRRWGGKRKSKKSKKSKRSRRGKKQIKKTKKYKKRSNKKRSNKK